MGRKKAVDPNDRSVVSPNNSVNPDLENPSRSQFERLFHVAKIKLDHVINFFNRFETVESIPNVELKIRLDALDRLVADCDVLVDRLADLNDHPDYDVIGADLLNCGLIAHYLREIRVVRLSQSP